MRRLPTILFMTTLLVLPGGLMADTLLFNLQTDYRPGDEFIQTTVTLLDYPTGEFRDIGRTTAFLSDDYTIGGGVRVAEFDDLSTGMYSASVSLRNASGAQVASRTVLMDLDVLPALVTAVISRPSDAIATAEKSAMLIVDNDGDGAVGVGDRVRYSVALAGAMERYVDELSEDLALVPGSVITTHGSVASGNDPADATIEIVGLGETQDPVLVEYEADVVPKVRNQGFLLVRGSFGTVWIPTDDPDTAQPDDPTLLDVACPISSCRGDLHACEVDRDVCEVELDECEIALADCGLRNEQLEAEVTQLSGRLHELLEDSDEDSVPAILDLCPGTPAGEEVDDRGCSLAQFCSAIDVAELGPQACNGADWLGDETGRNPGDCRARAGICEPAS